MPIVRVLEDILSFSIKYIFFVLRNLCLGPDPDLKQPGPGFSELGSETLNYTHEIRRSVGRGFSCAQTVLPMQMCFSIVLYYIRFYTFFTEHTSCAKMKLYS
jgi:hypothetical protein